MVQEARQTPGQMCISMSSFSSPEPKVRIWFYDSYFTVLDWLYLELCVLWNVDATSCCCHVVVLHKLDGGVLYGMHMFASLVSSLYHEYMLVDAYRHYQEMLDSGIGFIYLLRQILPMHSLRFC